MNKKHFIFLLLLAGLFVPSLSLAADGFDFINVKLNPKTPGVDQDVTVSLESYGVNLDSSEIIWYLDKDPIKQGVGEKSVTVRTGEFGTTLNLKAVVLSNLGKRLEKVITIAPSEIDLLWEAKTYTPPFYKGKAMPTFKSMVKVTAIPRYGQAASDMRSFEYNWKYNRTVGVGQGLGRNSALIQMGYADTAVPVSVEVSLPSSGWSGERSMNIRGEEALVLFYEQAPLLGTDFNKALGSAVAGSGNQFTIKAVPYFFSTDDVSEDALIYTWSVNNANTLPGLDQTIVTVSKKGEGAEQFDAKLKIQTPRHLLQSGGTHSVVSLPADQ